MLTFDTLHAERDWPEPLVKQLNLVAQVFANALSRKCADLELREKKARLSMTMAAAGAGLWSMEIDTGRVWVTPKTRMVSSGQRYRRSAGGPDCLMGVSLDISTLKHGR